MKLLKTILINLAKLTSFLRSSSHIIDLKSIVFGMRTFAIGTCFIMSALKMHLHMNETDLLFCSGHLWNNYVHFFQF